MKLNYLGTSFLPTENVDIYVDQNAIKKSYTIVGKGYAEGISISKKSYEIMQKKAIRKAKEKGADAILFQDHYIIENNMGMQGIARTDSLGSALINVQNTNVSPVVSSKPEIFFLKYN
ncbi:MAG: hypothetical protein ACXWCZ_11785 [Flavisolibacter sp.]